MMDYIAELEKNRGEMTAALRKIVKIKSVQEEPYEDRDGIIYPFGKGIEECYKIVLEMADEMGFDTEDFDHYGGHVELKAEGGSETFCIAAHVDVVPEGSGWTEHDPYGADVEDGYVYGRGTTDDKGPLIACLYAMKAIRDAGIKPYKNIRLIVGLDEEKDKVGMSHYLRKAGMPDCGITPDGDFPLINGEMGILIFDLAQKIRKSNAGNNVGIRLRKIIAGEAPNMVPSEAFATLLSENAGDYEKIIDEAGAYSDSTGNNIRCRKSGKALKIKASGKAAHGSRPWNGLNAVSVLMDFLGHIEFDGSDVNEFIDFYNAHIGFDLHGERIGCGIEDEPSGKLILNVGMAELNEEVASVTINIRYPVSASSEEIYGGIEKHTEDTEIGIIKKSHEPPVYIDPEDQFVQDLLSVYREETGDNESEPLVIGGGTYAKMMNRVLAFGSLFPGEEDRMHEAHERLNLDSFMKYARIYARAIYKIACERRDVDG